jgi:hypothetical protein
MRWLDGLISYHVKLQVMKIIHELNVTLAELSPTCFTMKVCLRFFNFHILNIVNFEHMTSHDQTKKI